MIPPPLPAVGGGDWPHTVILSYSTEANSVYAREIAAALLCTTGAVPCDCGICRRVREGIHPDVITLDRDSKEIVVGDIRNIRGDAHVSAVESERKVYIIMHSQNMNAAAQSAALIMFEEPPRGVYFILVCENIEAHFATILSRAVIINCAAGDNTSDTDQQPDGVAEEFIRALDKNDELALLEFALEHEKLKRPEFEVFIKRALGMLRGALVTALGVPSLAGGSVQLTGIGADGIYRMIGILMEAAGKNDRNVGISHLMGAIPAKFFKD